MPIRFQVDGDFYDHPKTTGMSDAAFSLWVRAGSFSAAKATDGFIAEDVLVLTLRAEVEVAEELVRRGLWRRVKGGYRFHQWDHRNLTKARVEADREADRDRKRQQRRSAAAEAKQQVNPPFVRPDTDRNLTGIHEESEGIPGASVSVSVSVSESVSGSGRDEASGPLLDHCPEHADNPDPPPCRACRDARLLRKTLAAEQTTHDLRDVQLRRQQVARDRAEASRLAIEACRQCDPTGYLPSGGLCPHDPATADRARRGAAEARAALLRKESA